MFESVHLWQSIVMHPALIVFWIVTGVSSLAGAVIAIVGLCQAPEAFEDADGFHYIDPAKALKSGKLREHSDVVHSPGATVV